MCGSKRGMIVADHFAAFKTSINKQISKMRKYFVKIEKQISSIVMYIVDFRHPVRLYRKMDEY